MNRHAMPRYFAAGILLGLIVTACSNRSANNTARTDSAAVTTTSAGRAPADSAMDDAAITAVLLVANTGDSSIGALAASRGVNSAVKQFGQRMVREHGQLNRQVKALATRLGSSAREEDNRQAVDMKHDADEEYRDLSAKTGTDFDHAYIDHEIDDHEKVLHELDNKLIPAADNAELRTLLNQARTAVQSHLDQARAIKNTLH